MFYDKKSTKNVADTDESELQRSFTTKVLTERLLNMDNLTSLEVLERASKVKLLEQKKKVEEKGFWSSIFEKFSCNPL